MAKNVNNVLRFPALDIEIADSGSNAFTSSGLTSPNVSITFEGEGQEEGTGQLIPTNGLGKLSVELIQSKQTDIAFVEAGLTGSKDIKFTDLGANTYTVKDVFLKLDMNRAAGPGAHTITYTGQRRVEKIGDFVVLA